MVSPGQASGLAVGLGSIRCRRIEHRPTVDFVGRKRPTISLSRATTSFFFRFALSEAKLFPRRRRGSRVVRYARRVVRCARRAIRFAKSEIRFAKKSNASRESNTVIVERSETTISKLSMSALECELARTLPETKTTQK